jgi:AcrR family transcriptional regulator
MAARRPSDTRERLLRAGEELFRLQGYSGTGLKELGRAADAPWGSIYHFFPDGKAQLGAKVVGHAGAFYGAGWRAAFERFEDVGEAVEWVFLAEARVLVASDFRNGCPVAAVTLDAASVSEDLRLACAGAFGLWLGIIEEALRAAGAPDQTAAALAAFLLSAIEGAIILSRAAKSPEPLLQSARFVRSVIDREAATWT